MAPVFWSVFCDYIRSTRRMTDPMSMLGVVMCFNKALVKGSGSRPGTSPAHKSVVASGVRTKAIGRSRYGAPDRSTQKMSSKNADHLPAARREPCSGNIGLMVAHSPSESS